VPAEIESIDILKPKIPLPSMALLLQMALSCLPAKEDKTDQACKRS
jgi:hypothetical protein